LAKDGFFINKTEKFAPTAVGNVQGGHQPGKVGQFDSVQGKCVLPVVCYCNCDDYSAFICLTMQKN